MRPPHFGADPRRTAIVVLSVAVLAILTGLFLFVYLNLGEDSGSIVYFLLVFPFLGALGAVTSFLLSVRKVRNSGVSLLFCRRFAQGGLVEERNRRIERILVDACRGLAIPITLKDASIPAPTSFSKGITAILWVVGIVLGIAVFFSVAILAKSWFLGFSGIAKLSVLVISLAATALVVIRIRGWIRSSIGNRGPGDASVVLRQAMARGYSRLDLLVVRSTLTDWQADVERILQDSTFAIVDVSSETSNIDWESGRALAVLGPKRVLFLSDSLGSRGIAEIRSWVTEVDGDLLVLKLPPGNLDKRTAAREHFASAKVLRDWLLDKHVAGTGAIANLTQTYDTRLAGAKRRAAIVYAFLAALFSFLMTPAEIGIAGALLIVSVATVFAYLIAHWVLSNSQLRTTPMGAIRRGAGIAIASSLSTFGVYYFFFEYLNLQQESGAGLPVFIVVAFIVILSLVYGFFGAIIGLIVEFVFFRAPSLDGASGVHATQTGPFDDDTSIT